ncbi:MAG TPA: hypothetical protein VLV83_02440 [Acidobacteriota bacterium]|nr:hypothetical protein [Acidobacteriota bacterium]
MRDKDSTPTQADQPGAESSPDRQEPTAPQPLSTKRKFKLYLLSGLFFAVVFALLFTAAELALRWAAQDDSAESRDHVMMTERLPITFKPGFQGTIWGKTFRTNHYGFRGEEDFPADKPADELRVLSLGDSIGFGLGIPARDHYTKVAQRRLQPRSRKRLRIINAGGQGYSPSSYAVSLQTQGMDLKPDVVVIEIELCNDVTDEALLGRTFRPQSPALLPWAVRGGRYLVSWDGNLLASYALGSPYPWERTYVWTDLTRRWLNLRFRLDPNEPFASHPEQTFYTLGFDRTLLTPPRIERGWSGLFDSLLGVHRWLDEEEVPFLLMIMPSRYLYRDNAPQRRAFALDLKERAVRMARERSIPFLDLSETIAQAGGAALFFDFAHLTVDGNEAVGERLAEALVPLLELPSEDDRPSP